jgi:hypothetical protein
VELPADLADDPGRRWSAAEPDEDADFEARKAKMVAKLGGPERGLTGGVARAIRAGHEARMAEFGATGARAGWDRLWGSPWLQRVAPAETAAILGADVRTPAPGP